MAIQDYGFQRTVKEFITPERKTQAMQAMQQQAQSDRATAIREAQRTGLKPGAGSIAGAGSSSVVPQQRALRREQELAGMEQDRNVASQLAGLSMQRRGESLESEKKQAELGMAQQQMGFEQQMFGKEKGLSERGQSLLNDETDRLRSELENKGQYLSQQNELKLRTLAAAEDQFKLELDEKRRQASEGRIATEDLQAAEFEINKKLQRVQQAYASQISEIQRVAQEEIARAQKGAAMEQQYAEMRAKKPGPLAGILGGISGVASSAGGFLGK